MSEEKKTTKKTQETSSGAAEVVTASTEESPCAAVVTAEQKGIFVYIGPSLPNGVLKKGSVFKGTRSEVLKHLKVVADKYPDVEQLLVASEKLAESKSRIQEGGNLLAVTYGKLAAGMKNK